jgi:hypothetical protein
MTARRGLAVIARKICTGGLSTNIIIAQSSRYLQEGKEHFPQKIPAVTVNRARTANIIYNIFFSIAAVPQLL